MEDHIFELSSFKFSQNLSSSSSDKLLACHKNLFLSLFLSPHPLFKLPKFLCSYIIGCMLMWSVHSPKTGICLVSLKRLYQLNTAVTINHEKCKRMLRILLHYLCFCLYMA